MAAEGSVVCSDADFDRLLEEESDSDKGWSVAKQTSDASVWRKKTSGESIHLLKGFLQYPGVPMKDVVELLTDIDLRKKWDTQFASIEVIESNDDHKVIHWVGKFPFPCKNRDVVQTCTVRKGDDKTMILYKHATHPKAPPQSNLVRAQTIFSGVVVRPNADDPNSSKVTLIFQIDFKGSIPASVINFLSTSSPLKSRDEMVKYYKKNST
ncbi:START domain-containing protein 10-like [Oscarella lobularis]|uniref:START domain-containing protein 10-like n=1 Tax=Oscarella lobularis TaxID=121494 RepID=UPI0033133795